MSSAMRYTCCSTAAIRPSVSNPPSSRVLTARCASCGPASSPAHRFSKSWASSPRAARHRACPPTPLEIIPGELPEEKAAEILERDEKVAVLAMPPPLHPRRYMTWINAGKKPEAYAHNLYNNLRTLDRAQCVRILVQELPKDERWAAILDRLQRASGGGGEDLLELSAG